MGLVAGTTMATEAVVMGNESAVRKAFSKEMLGQGIKTDASKLFSSGETNLFKKMVDVGGKSWQLLEKTAGHTGDFAKTFLKTPAGKFIAAGTLLTGASVGMSAHDRNQQIINRLDHNTRSVGYVANSLSRSVDDIDFRVGHLEWKDEIKNTGNNDF